MRYTLPRWTSNTSVREKALPALIRAIATVTKQARPEVFAHVQPHAHATAKLTQHFAASVFRNRSCGLTLKEIAWGAHMHDIGKYFIEASILLKPGALDEEERALVSLHSVYGATIVSRFPGVTDAIRCVVLHHHERWDGNGYPDGLKGTSIPIAARIVSIVDVYTSLRARRSYKTTFSKQQAFGILKEMAGHDLDPNLVEDFLKMVKDMHIVAGCSRIFV